MRSAQLLFIFFLVFLFASQGIAKETDSSAVEESGTTVLIYHRFGEDRYPSTNIDIERFREQLEYLKTNDYTVISLQQLVHFLQIEARLPERSVVITIYWIMAIRLLYFFMSKPQKTNTGII
jgi:biofilm PGA synthesis lipoprotein PgaB